MTYIIVLLFVSMMAFGLARQSITYPNENWNWLLVRNILYKPYFMLYGEVYASEIDTCGDTGMQSNASFWNLYTVCFSFLYSVDLVCVLIVSRVLYISKYVC